MPSLNILIQRLILLIVLLLSFSACGAEQTRMTTTIPATSTPEYFEIEDASALARNRQTKFSGQLILSIRSATAVLVQLPDSKVYELQLEVEIRNVSRDNILLNKLMIPGFDNYPRNASVILISNNLPLVSENISFTSVSLAPQQPSDFIEIGPNETLQYSWKVAIPTHLRSESGKQISVTGNTIEVYVKYENDSIGYLVEKSSAGPKSSQLLIVDMNAWVGTLESNHVNISFPIW